jgi:hypothetical protein
MNWVNNLWGWYNHHRGTVAEAPKPLCVKLVLDKRDFMIYRFSLNRKKVKLPDAPDSCHFVTS